MNVGKLDIPKLIERLKLKGVKRVARQPNGKFEGPCPHPEHKSNPHAWFIRDIPGEKLNGAHACQSCGFKGGPTLLVMTVLGCERDEAREFLEGGAAAYQAPERVELELRQGERSFELPEESSLNWQHAEPEALTYLQDRGISHKEIAEWGLRHIPQGALDSECEPSRLRGRLLVPIDDLGSHHLSYTARSYTGAEPRYKEPRAEEHPIPGAIFGECRWVSRGKPLVVVEGTFDAMAVWRLVPECDVAAFAGSSLHPAQVVKLRPDRHSAIICLSDPDKAGRKFARALRDAVVRTMPFERVDLPEGTDPAKMALEDPDGLRQRILAAF